VRESIVGPLLGRLIPTAKMGKYLHLSTLALEQRYLNVHLFDIRLREQLYHPDYRRALQGYDPIETIRDIYRRTEGWDTLNRLLYLDIKTWLADDILIKSDRMSMAASLELREPFLDFRLVEFAARIPPRLKLRRGRTKHVLKQALGRLLPRDILYRRKMGFPSPLARLFRGELHDYVREVLLDHRSRCRKYFDAVMVRRLIDQHFGGKADHHTALWRLLVLEEWHRRFVDRPLLDPTPARC
jgi:asparagine synthase (glutamine-hydrolysing)